MPTTLRVIVLVIEKSGTSTDRFHGAQSPKSEWFFWIENFERLRLTCQNKVISDGQRAGLTWFERLTSMELLGTSVSFPSCWSCGFCIVVLKDVGPRHVEDMNCSWKLKGGLENWKTFDSVWWFGRVRCSLQLVAAQNAAGWEAWELATICHSDQFLVQLEPPVLFRSARRSCEVPTFWRAFTPGEYPGGVTLLMSSNLQYFCMDFCLPLLLLLTFHALFRVQSIEVWNDSAPNWKHWAPCSRRYQAWKSKRGTSHGEQLVGFFEGIPECSLYSDWQTTSQRDW